MRAVSFQTSRASVSRETTCPWWRSRYSSSSNSRTVRSSGAAAARHLARHEVHVEVADASRGASVARPARTSARIRASSSANANGFTR